MEYPDLQTLNNVNRLLSDVEDKCWLENLVDFEY